MKKDIRIWIYSLVVVGAFLMLTTHCKKGDDSNNNPTSSATVTDIDGNVYNTVTIGTQVWMVENLKTTKYQNGDPIPNVTNDAQWRDLTSGAYCNYNNDAAIGTKYGKLYNWFAVYDSRNMAPAGWHVPTYDEWIVLENYVAANTGTSVSVAKALAAKRDWEPSTDSGTVGKDLAKNNTSGFSGLPGGKRDESGESGIFYGVGYLGIWWSSTDYQSGGNYRWGGAYARDFVNDGTDLITKGISKTNGFSVRCLRDRSTNAVIPIITTTTASSITTSSAFCGGNIISDGEANVTERGVCWNTTGDPTIANNKTTDGSGIGSFTSNITGLTANTTYYLRAYASNNAGTGYGNVISFTTLIDHTGKIGTVSDIEGNVYKTIGIGSQIWMAENLKTTKYRNGNSIPQLDNWDWAVNSGPGYGYPAGNPNNNSLYGKLYNWYAANNSNNIAPQGWHIPSIEEYQTLIDFLGGNMVAGSKMKTSNYWWTFDGIGTVAPTNSSGFSMLPAGSLRDAGMSGIDDLGIGGIGYLWSSGENGNGYLIRVLYCNNISGSGLPEILSTQDSKSFGFSVRCVKD